MNAVVSPLVRGALGPRVRPQGITKAAVEKTLLASSTAAYLPVQEADVLIDYVTNESKLLRESNVLKMDKNTRNLDSLDISTGVLRKATEGTCPDTAEVTTERKQIVTQEMIATLPISDSWVEDNVEGEAGADRAVRMLVDQLANDAEIISLMASLPANVFWDDAGQDTTTMRMWNGWYALMRLNASVLDATEDTEAEGRGISICKLKKLVQCLATKYRRRKEDLRIYMSENLHLDLVKIKMDRETPLGDRLLIEGLDWEADKFAGIPIVPIPLIPENVDSCPSGTLSDADGTFMWITPKANQVLGIQRQIRYERERSACKRQTTHVLTLRMVPDFANYEAVCLYDCLKVTACA